MLHSYEPYTCMDAPQGEALVYNLPAMLQEKSSVAG